MILGITGHRKLSSPADVTVSIRTVLERLLERTRSRGEPLVLYSPLAEGADRLAAQAALALGGIELKVLMPLPREDYRCDFKTEQSVREFEALLAQAGGVEALPARAHRPEAYRALGEELVRRCEVILAVWDGRPAKGGGGTAEVVAMARSQGRSLVWIKSRDPSGIVWEGT